MTEDIDLTYLLDLPLSPDNLAEEHALDISASVYRRMKEMKLTKSNLAQKMGVSPSRITKIIKGQSNLTLKTIAKIECALDIHIILSEQDMPINVIETVSQEKSTDDFLDKSIIKGCQDPDLIYTNSIQEDSLQVQSEIEVAA